jgi:hypothetical protein
MNEPESSPPKSSSKLPDLQQLRERIQDVAVAEHQAADINKPDELALSEKETLERGKVTVELDRLRTEVRQTKRLNWIRIILIGALFFLVVMWLVALMTVLMLQGFSGFTTFHLSDKVLITYITSTTVSVLGLFHIAARWLFPGTVIDAKQGG